MEYVISSMPTNEETCILINGKTFIKISMYDNIPAYMNWDILHELALARSISVCQEHGKLNEGK